MRTLEDLVKKMKKFNDTVIIIGPGIFENKEIKYTTEEFNNTYNRKMLSRKVEDFWNFYLNKIYEPIQKNTIYSYINSLNAFVIDQNINGVDLDNKIDLHGNCNKYFCKCGTMYTHDYITSKQPFENICELCGRKLKPSVLLSNDKYNASHVKQITEAIDNTHCLMLIGVDFTEEFILECIHQYSIKDVTNKNLQEEDKKTLVTIQNENEEFDINELLFSEYVVKGDIENSLKKLIIAYCK